MNDVASGYGVLGGGLFYVAKSQLMNTIGTAFDHESFVVDWYVWNLTSQTQLIVLSAILTFSMCVFQTTM